MVQFSYTEGEGDKAAEVTAIAVEEIADLVQFAAELAKKGDLIVDHSRVPANEDTVPEPTEPGLKFSEHEASVYEKMLQFANDDGIEEAEKVFDPASDKYDDNLYSQYWIRAEDAVEAA